MGWFYGDARAVGLTQAFAALIILGALPTQPAALLNRGMRFRLSGRGRMVSALVGFLGAVRWPRIPHLLGAVSVLRICAAVNLPGVWIGSGFVPGRHGGSPARGRWSVSGRESGFNVFNFIVRNLDNVLIGRVWGDAALGPTIALTSFSFSRCFRSMPRWPG